jgi:tRNA(fMet)-specific endonuclease VapC
MNGSFLLDTNIVIALREGQPAVVERVAKAGCYLSATIEGELYYGAFHSPRSEESLRKLRPILDEFAVIPLDAETGRHFGMMKQYLSKMGTRLPERDMWIAATAQQHELVLVTRDDHFTHVPNLQTQRW